MGSAKAVISRKLPTPPARRKCLPWLGWPMLHGKDQLQEQEKVSRRKKWKQKDKQKREVVPPPSTAQPGLD
jgi:hypothetical protein